MTKQPMFEQTMTKQPMFEQTMTKQPMFEQTMTKQPMFEQSVTKQPMFEQSVTKQPMFEQSVTKQPIKQYGTKTKKNYELINNDLNSYNSCKDFYTTYECLFPSSKKYNFDCHFSPVF
jgi:hypothetical protein